MKKDFLMYMGGQLRKVMSEAEDSVFKDIREIRIRADKPLIIRSGGREYFLDINGKVTDEANAFKPSAKDLCLTAEILGGYSLYAFDEELKNGFITIEGGHRVGICGKAVIDNGSIKTLRNITSLNLRIAAEVKGCAYEVMGHIVENSSVFNTLIVSPPGGGKTTFLRDIIRTISNGYGGLKGKTVGVCDERSEIGASFGGRVRNDVGIRTDVIDCCPKDKGILMLLRSMAPDVIAVDEIGTDEDIEAIKKAIVSGVKLICTAHGERIEDVYGYKGIFERYIMLCGADKVGKIKAIYDRDFKEMRKSDY